MADVRTVTYVSFAVPSKCLGVLILDGEFGVAEAAIEAHRLNLSPGGYILAVPCRETDQDIPKELFETLWNNRNRLIPDTEVCTLFNSVSIRVGNVAEVKN